MCVGDEEFNDFRLMKMECDFLFGSLEVFLGDRKWCERLQIFEYQRKIKLIVVDEVYIIVQWQVIVFLKIGINLIFISYIF